MARPQSISDGELLDRLEQVFCRVGYDGASLSALATAAGLQKASLYHRFPGGKAQMALDVVAASRERLHALVLEPLLAEGAPKKRLAQAVAGLQSYYREGERTCLFNILATPGAAEGELATAIEGAFREMLMAFTQLAEDAGAKPKKAQRKAEKAVIAIQGALVAARGLNDTAPFSETLDKLSDDLL